MWFAQKYPGTLFMDQQAKLSLLTFENRTTDPECQPCSGSFVCPCPDCDAERVRLVKRGVRKTTPLPVRRAA